MSEPNPDEVGNVPDSPEWTTAQPRDDAWGVPHAHSADQGRFDQPSPAAGGPPPPNQPPSNQPYAGQQSLPAQPVPGQPPWTQYGQGQNQPGSYPLYPGQPHPGGYPPQFPQAPPVGAWSPPLRSDYAHWGRRVGAYLIDFAQTLPASGGSRRRRSGGQTSSGSVSFECELPFDRLRARALSRSQAALVSIRLDGQSRSPSRRSTARCVAWPSSNGLNFAVQAR